MENENYSDYLAKRNISIHDLIKLKYENPPIVTGIKKLHKSEWERKKEYEIIKLFMDFNIRPNTKNKLITINEWVEAFNNIRLLPIIYENKNNSYNLFIIRLNSMIMNNEIKYEDREKAQRLIEKCGGVN